MRITTRFRRITPAAAPAPTPGPAAVPPCCAGGLAHCHGTLVLHADGTVECEQDATCAADEAQHDLWVACHELGCGCVGDDAPLEAWALAIAA